jgi:uroporphyrinogen-III synthase
MKKKILYTGIEYPQEQKNADIFHFPLISMKRRSLSLKETKQVFDRLYSYSHILFTSKYAVQSFFLCKKELNIPKDHLESVFLLAIGLSTMKALEKEGVYITYAGSDETEEGAIRLLETLDLKDCKLLLPQSGMTRAKFIYYLEEKDILYDLIILYDLHRENPQTKVNLKEFDEIIFTSPVAVDAFFNIYEDLPHTLQVHCMGMMTRCKIKSYLTNTNNKIGEIHELGV